MSFLNPSKGVDYYVFLAKKNYCVKYKAPDDLGFGHSDKIFHYQDEVSMQTNHIEISKLDISLWTKSGRLEWKVYKKDTDDEDNKIAGKYIDINPGTGNVGSTNIEPTLHEDSIVDKDNNYAISYGFYDASSGHFSCLTNYDQSYVYVTPCLSTWMEDLVASNPKYGLCQFNTFALAGSHDAGMYNSSEAMKLVKNKEYTKFLAKSADDFSNNHGIKLTEAARKNIKDYIKLFQKLAAIGGEDIIVNLAMTQKDDITMQLDLGIRFFDIRPGFCSYANSFTLPTKVSQATGINNLYHQHALVPGMSFDQILTEALKWLDKNKKEIIVMNLNFQGFVLETMKPTPQFLNEYINNIISGLNITINTGSESDLNTAYNDLIKSHKRLIFLNQIGESTDAKKYDSYNNSYQTTSADVIINALNEMNKSGQKDADYTVLQLQGTANALISDIADSSATLSDLTSPLMSTKANFDTKTYAWINDNVCKNFEHNQLIVFLNDFADNALAQQSCWITQNRMDK